MAALVVIGGAIAIAFGERIGINLGQGWDGISYTQWAQDFSRTLHDGLTRYHAQRVLPSGVVALVLGSHDIPHVLRMFAIANVAVLASAAIAWSMIASRWSRLAAWAGFVALFVTFSNAKHATYYPALTDPAAFALGTWMVWAYLTDRPIALWTCALLGCVTWPALPPLAVAMLLLPRPHDEVSSPASRLERRLATGLAVAAAVTFVIVGCYYLAHPVPGVGDEKFASWVPRTWLVVTVPTLLATLAIGLYFVLAPVRLTALRAYLRGLSRRRLVTAVTAVVGLYILRGVYLAKVGTHGEGPTGAQFLCEQTLAALRGPLWGLVHHVVYFGPIVALAIVTWKRVTAITASWGPAAVLGLAMTVAFAGGSNSRQWSHLAPLLVTATIAATEWTRARLIVFTALSTAWSKIWFHLGYDTVLDWHEFPNQRYFMNAGPYAATGPFLVHLAAAAMTVAILWWLFRPRSVAIARGGAPCLGHVRLFDCEPPTKSSLAPRPMLVYIRHQ